MRKSLNSVFLWEVAKYLITFLIVAFVILLKLYFIKPLGLQILNSLMIAALLIIARFIGVRHAVLALVISIPGLNYFIYSPFFQLSFSTESILQSIAFITEASAVIYIIFRLLKSKQANQSSANKFEKFIENSRDGIVLLDINSRVIYASSGIERVLGYTPEEFCSITPAELMDIEELPIIQQMFEGFNDAFGISRTATHKFKHKNGHWIWIESTITNLLKDPDVKAILSNFRDVSSIRNLESEQNKALELHQKLLYEAEQARLKFEFLANNMDHKVWMQDEIGKISYINQAWLDYSAIKTKEEWTPEMVVPQEDQKELYRKWDEALVKGEEFSFEQKYRRYDDEDRWHIVKAFPLKDQAGKIISWVGVNTDIHELKTQNQEFKESQNLLAKKDEFISIASHELKTPLTSLKASLQLLDKMIGREKTSPLIVSLTSKANKNINRLSDLVGDLLNSTRIERGQVLLKKKLFLIKDLIDECSENIRSEDKYNLIITGDPNLKAYADQRKVEQVLTNLINNAIKYSPNSNTIKISYEQIGNMVKIKVQDFGVGVPQEKLPFLFDRYYRVDDNGIQFSGLGLGLYISSQIIHKHGGEIGAESVLNEGSTFWFSLHLNEEE